MSLQATLNHATDNWKTTVGALLTVMLTLSGILTASPTWAADYGLSRHGAMWLTLGIAGIKLTVGYFTRDANQTTVNLPQGSAPAQINIPAGSTVNQTTKIETPEQK
jgi:hypothetical protein